MSDPPFPVREEIATAGFDPFRQLAPDSNGAPASTGLLVPPLAGITYRFLAAYADLDAGDAVIGIRQYLDLIAYLALGPPPGGGAPGDAPALPIVPSDGTPPIYPLRQPIDDPLFRLIDGGDTWTLTRQPKRQPDRLRGPLDRDSFIFRDTNGSGLVYETAAFPPLLALPGYPGLSAYTRPSMQGTKALTIRDRRYPWTSQSCDRLRFVSEAPETWRLYVDITQSNPATRAQPTLTGASNVGYSLPPPAGFLEQPFGALAVYGFVAGALIIERKNRSRED